MPTVAEAISRFLERHGVELFVGQSLPSALHLAAEETSIRQVHVRTENAGTAMCDAYARLTGKIPVMTAQNGPAATLLVPGLAEALKASIPILAIVQEVDFAHREKNAFQEFDHRTLFQSCAKWVGTLESAERVYDFVKLALTHAATGRPGPAVLMVPAGILLEEAPDVPEPLSRRATFPLDRPSAAAAEVERAARQLIQAERPLIVAGGGVHTSGAAHLIERLQREAGFPVGTTLMGKGAVQESHPLSLGVIGYLMGRMAPNREHRAYVEAADVVLFVGTRNNQNGTDGWRLYGPSSRFIHIDIDGVEVGRTYDSLRLVGDARETLSSLVAAVWKLSTEEERGERGRRLSDRLPARRQLQQCIPASDAAGIRPEHLVETLNRCAPDGTIFAADASYSSAWLAGFGLARTSNDRFILPRGLAGLGWGLPYTLGAKLACPERTVVGISGDGGFAHVWSELETAARYRLNTVSVVLKNGVLGYQRDAERVKFGHHTTAIPIGEIDHAAIARATGCVGISVETADDFEQAFKEALATDRPVVLDVRTDPTAFPTVSLFDDLYNETPAR